MAWWNEMLTNTARRLQVLGNISGKLEQLVKMSPSGLTVADVGALRIKPDNTGFQRWSGSAWVDVVLDIEKGGTGATTAAEARTALGIVDSGSGAGTAIGEMNFSRDLVVGQNTEAVDRIVRVDGDNLRFRVASENYVSTIAPVNQSEGSVAFRVLSDTGVEIVIGFIDEVTVTNPEAGVTEVVITGNQMLGRGILDRNLLPLIGNLNSTVRLELWRRGVAARDMSLVNAVKLANVDLSTAAITTAWRAALGVPEAIWLANPINYKRIGSYSLIRSQNIVPDGKWVADNRGSVLPWVDRLGNNTESLLREVQIGDILRFSREGEITQASAARITSIQHDVDNTQTIFGYTEIVAITIAGIGLNQNAFVEFNRSGFLGAAIGGTTKFLREDGTFAIPQ